MPKKFVTVFILLPLNDKVFLYLISLILILCLSRTAISHFALTLQTLWYNSKVLLLPPFPPIFTKIYLDG